MQYASLAWGMDTPEPVTLSCQHAHASGVFMKKKTKEIQMSASAFKVVLYNENHSPGIPFPLAKHLLPIFLAAE